MFQPVTSRGQMQPAAVWHPGIEQIIMHAPSGRELGGGHARAS
jgi:hypothetical protein